MGLKEAPREFLGEDVLLIQVHADRCLNALRNFGERSGQPQLIDHFNAAGHEDLSAEFTR